MMCVCVSVACAHVYFTSKNIKQQLYLCVLNAPLSPICNLGEGIGQAEVLRRTRRVGAITS